LVRHIFSFWQQFFLGLRLRVFVIRFGDFQIFKQIFEYRVVQWINDFHKASFFYKDRNFFLVFGKEKNTKTNFLGSCFGVV